MTLAKPVVGFLLLLAMSHYAAGDDLPGDLAGATPGEILDLLHERASAADYDGYMALFREDGVFLGTDASERWPVSEFRDYVRERFSTGTGWTYHPRDRHLAYSPDGSTVWFDEIAVGEAMGPCRGTGVLVRGDAGWRIAHYSLTVLVPNDVVMQVVELAREAPADSQR